MSPRELVEQYLDLCHRHRLLFHSLMRDPSVVGELGGLTRLMNRRKEEDLARVGSDDPSDRVRAILAFGGLQDRVLYIGDTPLESYATAAVESALRALRPG